MKLGIKRITVAEWRPAEVGDRNAIKSDPAPADAAGTGMSCEWIEDVFAEESV